MKNYKLALFNAINDNVTAKEDLNDYSKDFLKDYTANDSSYICDAISSFSDNNTDIYYGGIMDFIKNNVEALEDAIDEFGWDGCGGTLHKAGQMAQYITIERDIYNDLEDIVKWLACDLLDSDESEDDEETAEAWEKLTEEQQDELTEDFLTDLEAIDHNNRLDDIADLFEEYKQQIIDKLDEE